MTTREMLVRSREDFVAQRKVADREISIIDAAIKAIDQMPSSTQLPPTVKPNSAAHPMKVDDAIVEAVAAGNKSPVNILGYLADTLGVKTTMNSVRTRVSKLNKSGRIGRGEDGWVPVNENGEAEASPETGEVAPSPIENRMA